LKSPKVEPANWNETAFPDGPVDFPKPGPSACRWFRGPINWRPVNLENRAVPPRVCEIPPPGFLKGGVAQAAGQPGSRKFGQAAVAYHQNWRW